MAKKKTARKKKAAPEKAAARRRAAPEPVLDISTLAVRQSIRIDGKRYEIRNQRELGVLGLKRLEAYGARIDELNAIDPDDLTAEQDSEMGDLLDRICRIVLAAPSGVQRKLAPAERLLITNVFIGAPVPSTAQAGAAA